MSEHSIIKNCMSAVNSQVQNLVYAVRNSRIGSQSSSSEPIILYFGKDIPTAEGLVHGGAVKLQRLQEHFPVSKERCNILYLVSSSQPPYAEILIDQANKRGVKVVWNQNGISYPASDPEHWEETNLGMKKLIHKVDYVIYQSKFCKESADEFLGVFNGSQSVIYNSVDSNIFTPRNEARPERPLTLLLGGNQYRKYRLETALKTVAELKKEVPDIHLIVTGKVAWDDKKEDDCLHEAYRAMETLGITENVEFIGQYSQKDAPTIYRRADILLHTKWRDPCPGLVIEAMSCGLPVVYSESGGMPELVGPTAGIGVQAKGSWDEIDPPDPKLLCAAVLQVAESLDWYSTNARERAVEMFDLSQYMTRHQNVFKEILNQ